MRFAHLLASFSLLILLAACGSGSTPPNVTIVISPSTASLPVATGSQSFTATVTGSSNHQVTWQVNAVTGGSLTTGTISATGLYTAPAAMPSPTTVTITALSVANPADTANATVTITPPLVSIAPLTATVGIGQTTTFVATVDNSDTKTVTWQVNGIAGGNSTVGTISASGLYTAPASVPAPAVVTISAVSTLVPASTGSASLTVSATLSTIAPLTATLTATLTPTRIINTQQFAASLDSGGATHWSTTDAGGNVSNTGLYTPSGTPGSYTVTATNGINTVTAAVAITDLPGIYTYHYDAQRTGQNVREYALTPASVAATTGPTFGKRFSCALDAEAYAQPLYVANLSIGGGVHNVIFVATHNDSVYAFDADSTSCVTYWKRSFLSSGVTRAVPAGTVKADCLNILTSYGITGTPVIDPTTNTMYLVATTQNISSKAVTQTLYGISLATGANAVTAATIAATGSPQNFSPLYQLQRAGLAFYNGNIYIAWASHCDVTPYNGWFMRYDVKNGALRQEATFNVTPGQSRGGIWMSGGAPAIDSTPRIFLSTGNGTFNDTTNTLPAPNNSFSESFLALDPTSLGVVDFYTPAAEALWSDQDLDIASAGVVSLPDNAGPAGHPNVLIGASKQGYLWMMDRANMSGYSGTLNNTVQFLRMPGIGTCLDCVFSTPAYWNGNVYTHLVGGPVLALKMANGLMPATGVKDGPPLELAYDAKPTTKSTEHYGYPGPTPVISAAGASNGIVWTLDNSANGTEDPETGNPTTLAPAILRAYDATNLATTLYSSARLPADTAGTAVKFQVPVVANGHVYIAGGQLTVYGLTP